MPSLDEKIDTLTRLAEEFRTIEMLSGLADRPEDKAYMKRLARLFRSILDDLSNNTRIMGGNMPWWFDWQRQKDRQ